MTIEAFQYAPNKRAALAELFTLLKPGARIALVCFEVDPAKVAGLPVLGVDPIPDYTRPNRRLPGRHEQQVCCDGPGSSVWPRSGFRVGHRTAVGDGASR